MKWDRAISVELGAPARSTPVEWAFAVVVACAVLALTQWRMRFGATLADEAYYVAIPMRYVRHDMPFRDDVTSLFSMFAFLTYPLFKAYVVFHRSTDGIIAYSRHAYLITQCLVACAVYLGIRKLVSGAAALLIATMLVAFVPFNIPSLSYNTIAEDCLVVGLLAAAWGIGTERRALTTSSGLMLALSVAIYPTLAPVWGAIFILTFITSRRQSALFVLGSVAGVVALAPFLRHASPENVRASLYYYSHLGHHDPFVRKAVLQTIGAVRGVWLGLTAFAVAYMALRRSALVRVSPAFILIPFALYEGNLTPRGEVFSAHQFVVALALTGAIVFRALDADERRVLALVWIPSALAALIMACSSTNGYWNSGIGFVGGALMSLVMVVRATGRWPGWQGTRGRWSHLALLTLVLAIFVGYQYWSVYWDSNIERLTARVPAGPYKGIWTTPRRAEFLAELGRDLAQCCTAAVPIVFYQDFPAGYLFTEARAATNTLWLASPSEYPDMSMAALSDYYRVEQNRPGVIVKMREVPWVSGYKTVQYDPRHPVDRLLASGAYEEVADRPEYEIWARASTPTKR